MNKFKIGDKVKILPSMCSIFGTELDAVYDVYHLYNNGCYIQHGDYISMYGDEWLILADGTETAKTEEPTGGFSGHYLATVDKPQRGGPSYQAECDDIIYALRMTFDEGEAFKAIWRTCTARLGYGKKDNTALYNAQKLVHRSKRVLQRAEEQENGK